MRIKPVNIWCPVHPKDGILWAYACETKKESQEDVKLNNKYDDVSYWSKVKVMQFKLSPAQSVKETLEINRVYLTKTKSLKISPPLKLKVWQEKKSKWYRTNHNKKLDILAFAEHKKDLCIQVSQEIAFIWKMYVQNRHKHPLTDEATKLAKAYRDRMMAVPALKTKKKVKSEQ